MDVLSLQTDLSNEITDAETYYNSYWSVFIKVSAWGDKERSAWADWKRNFNWNEFFPKTPYPLLELRQVFYKPDGNIALRATQADYRILHYLLYHFDWVLGYTDENGKWEMKKPRYEYPAITQLCQHLTSLEAK